MHFYFVAFELFTFILLIICFLHARTQGKPRLVELITLVVNGLLLEKLTILFFREYTYGDGFLIMVQDVPLSIAFGWAAIIYSAMETTNMLGIPLAARPLYDTLLALNIDLSMDAIAIRAGFWKWLNGGEWFGVPYGNFLGWICVVFFFSFSVRLLRKHPPGNEAIRVITILVSSLLPLILMLKIWALWVPDILKGAIIAGILLIFLTVVLLKSKGFANSHNYRIMAVPFVFHIFFLFLLIHERFYAEVPLLLPLSAGMLILGFTGHFPQSVRRSLSKGFKS